MMDQIIFYILALITCLCALRTVMARDIFHAAVWLVMALLGIASIYWELGAEFLAVIQVIVYVGAIMTLFIFAIMLTARIDDRSIKASSDQLWISLVFVLALFATLVLNLVRPVWLFKDSIQSALSLKDLGMALMTRYVLPFEFISLLLLAAMVGAIVIGRRKR